MSRFFSKVQAYDLIELDQQEANEFLCSWIHSASSKPYIRRLFLNFILDDEIQELTYEMKYSVDEYSDEEFILEILGMGVVIEWLEPRINSALLINQVYGSKEEKFYSQSSHLATLQNLKTTLVQAQRQTIVDRGYAWNSYLDGDK